MCGIWPLFHRCSSLSAFLLSPPQLRQSLCTHLHATHLSLSFFLPPSLTIQIYYIDVNQADEPTIVKKHCPVACNVCTPLNCEDNADYRDPGGFPCGEGAGREIMVTSISTKKPVREFTSDWKNHCKEQASFCTRMEALFGPTHLNVVVYTIDWLSCKRRHSIPWICWISLFWPFEVLYFLKKLSEKHIISKTLRK